MTLSEIVWLGIILVDIIGFYYAIKVFISYYRDGIINFNPTIVKGRCYHLCLMSLCFLGVAIANYILRGSNWQIFYAIIHSFSIIMNYQLYQKYSQFEGDGK
jgi:hypothetical protein